MSVLCDPYRIYLKGDGVVSMTTTENLITIRFRFIHWRREKLELHLMMETARRWEMLVSYTTLHGVTSRKTSS
jgi:hypothetical protein